ncbi:hypothetical protein QLQ80_00630 [Mycoplasma sp. M5725]|uniref:Uncharacterized protein n=1 Tax=Mycoplasma phocimorsus TaxID=3045839 RepID=A0AAJ1PS83_9MOLU|nr:hypothetical protein [Mycoplasma phocimorsus]MDJ1645596.1 hypothetical protein [Mycoplasma phocimorsus]
MFKKIMVLKMIITPLASISCSQKEENITIWNSWLPDEFKKEGMQFVTNFNNKINNLIKIDSELKDIGKINFEFKSNNNDVIYQNIISNKENCDFAIVPYRVFKNLNLDEIDFQIAMQTATKSFSWAYDDESIYGQKSFSNITNSYNEKLNLSDSFENWGNNYGYKNGIYSDFYKTGTSSTYRGQIIISGDKDTLNSIKTAWNNKDLKKFINYGIIFKSKKSSGAYKLQRSLLSKHFNVDINEIENKLDSINDEIVLLKNPGEFIGKSTEETGLKKIYHIAFTDHGVFNWTKSKNKLFTPKKGDKLEILSVTNPAPYSVMIARKGLNPKLVNLIKKVFAELKTEENVYGNFTGYAKFYQINLNTFKALLNNYNYSENNIGSYQSPKELLKNGNN